VDSLKTTTFFCVLFCFDESEPRLINLGLANFIDENIEKKRQDNKNRNAKQLKKWGTCISLFVYKKNNNVYLLEGWRSLESF